ncbi:MAG: hypothetical protein SFX73_28730 [Kofleriaceae bacterium]|nr:hypothetical protein [Kofleriaceae bacterium]
MLGIPAALIVFGAGEWAAHKFLLHGLGRDRASRFSFHYHEHHQAVRLNGGYDPAYEGPPWSSSTQARELAGLSLVAVAHAPLFPIAPFYTSTIWYCLYRYRRDHRRAHLDPAWARDHLPHHYDHHLGLDQDMNFGVVWSWFDLVMKTREIFVGTGKERVMHARHADRAATASAGAQLRAQRRSPIRRLLGAAARLRANRVEAMRATRSAP